MIIYMSDAIFLHNKVIQYMQNGETQKWNWIYCNQKYLTLCKRGENNGDSYYLHTSSDTSFFSKGVGI